MRIWHIAMQITDDIRWDSDEEAAGQIAAAVVSHLKRAGVEIAEAPHSWHTTQWARTTFGAAELPTPSRRALAIEVRPSCDQTIRPGQPWRCSLPAGHPGECVSENGYQGAKA